MYTGGDGFSIPTAVMRTGMILPFNPNNAQRQVSEQHVEEAVRYPVGQQPGGAQYAPPPEPAPTGTLLGAGADSQAVYAFDMPGLPSMQQATGAGEALKQAAKIVRGTGIGSLVGGPLASLARGDTIVLRWSNGAAIQATL